MSNFQICWLVTSKKQKDFGLILTDAPEFQFTLLQADIWWIKHSFTSRREEALVVPISYLNIDWLSSSSWSPAFLSRPTIFQRVELTKFQFRKWTWNFHNRILVSKRHRISRISVISWLRTSIHTYMLIPQGSTIAQALIWLTNTMIDPLRDLWTAETAFPFSCHSRCKIGLEQSVSLTKPSFDFCGNCQSLSFRNIAG